MTDEIRKQALAEYLDIDTDEIEDSYMSNEYTTDDGDYLVVTYEEAEDLAREDISNSIDELGIEFFSENFQNWIKDNALDKEWFDSAMDESNRFYVEDIQYESGRYREELIDAGLIDEDDARDDNELTEDYELFDEMVDYLNKLYNDDSIAWYIDNFGIRELSSVIKDNTDILDVDVICDEVISVDGVANSLARYDGEEIELGEYDGEWLYAYRTN